MMMRREMMTVSCIMNETERARPHALPPRAPPWPAVPGPAHWDVVADHVKVAFPRVKLDGKAAGVAQRLWGTALVDHCAAGKGRGGARNAQMGAAAALPACQGRTAVCLSVCVDAAGPRAAARAA